jgi:hypothetical protein
MLISGDEGGVCLKLIRIGEEGELKRGIFLVGEGVKLVRRGFCGEGRIFWQLAVLKNTVVLVGVSGSLLDSSLEQVDFRGAVSSGAGVSMI